MHDPRKIVISVQLSHSTNQTPSLAVLSLSFSKTKTSTIAKMPIFQGSWQAKARAKVADMESKIPKEWILEQADLEDAKQRRCLTGPFIEKFLHDSEVDIIRNDSVQLVEKIKSQHYTAVEVARAYCKTAAVAQQIVSQHL